MAIDGRSRRESESHKLDRNLKFKIPQLHCYSGILNFKAEIIYILSHEGPLHC